LVKYQTLHKQLLSQSSQIKSTKIFYKEKRWVGIYRNKKTLKRLLKVACPLESTTPKPAKNGIKYWCQDETLIGLKKIERKKNTAFGVKAIGKVKWNLNKIEKSQKVIKLSVKTRFFTFGFWLLTFSTSSI